MANKKEFDIEINIDTKEKAIARTHYNSFSEYCYWLLMRYSDGERIFYVRDLSKKFKIGYTSAFRFFQELHDLGYLQLVKTGHFTNYVLINNSKEPKLKELLPYVIKTLKRYK